MKVPFHEVGKGCMSNHMNPNTVVSYKTQKPQAKEQMQIFYISGHNKFYTSKVS